MTLGIHLGGVSLAQTHREGYAHSPAAVFAETLSLSLRYPALHRAQWYSRERLEALQWRRFKRILRVAHAESPFYRQRFEEAGISPEAIRDRSDLERIPITTREDLRNPEELICTGYRAGDLHCSLTTGSTGRRTRSYFDDRSWILAKHLLKLRARLTTGVSPTDRIALLQESDTADRGSAASQRLLRLRSFSIDLPRDILLEQLREFNPTVLYGFPSHLRRLGSETSRDFRISRVYTSGELLAAEERTQIEQAFDAPVLDVYGCTEVKEIAWQCLEQGGYHINGDWILVEVLESESSIEGEGPIVVTSLYNRAMPLIRYQLGDTGTLLQEPCNCGRGLPLMRPTGGRTVDYFEIPDGSSVSPYAMTFAMEKVPGVRQFQIIQMSTDQVRVKVVADSGLEQSIPGEVGKHLAEVLPDVKLEVQLVQGIEPDRSGKFRIVSSRSGEAE